ncbi:uncharacterized protein LOC131891871 [Tigriopus californicus]|uniref:uncharacterized protein LOC131891871 n=1 Tax=Tigriopus californicus TaxID=6832 RepID=UPI0027DA2A69|nr:uncharacterized protein LOC131891871 [Tigriopus californicus]
MDDESSGTMTECNGDMNQEFIIQIPIVTGCFLFQTPGFNDGGYPNYSGSDSNSYICSYVFQFVADVNGTVTFEKAGFELQGRTITNDCVDAIGAVPVMRDFSDIEESGPQVNFATFCGVISEDKIRRFSFNSLSIVLFADDAVNGNGAKVEVCFD